MAGHVTLNEDDEKLYLIIRAELARWGFAEAKTWCTWPELIKAIMHIVKEDRKQREPGTGN